MPRPLQKVTVTDVAAIGASGTKVIYVSDFAANGVLARYLHVTGISLVNRTASAAVFQIHDVDSLTTEANPIKVNVPANDTVYFRFGGEGIRFTSGIRAASGAADNEVAVFYYEA